MSKLRNQAYAKGYSLNYTFGIHKVATLYPWRNGKVYVIDMFDTIKGSRELAQIIKKL